MKKISLVFSIVLAALMLLSFGAFADEATVEYVIPVGTENVAEGTVEVASVEDADIIVVDVSSQDFYADGGEFTITVNTQTRLWDAKDKLKLSVIDTNEQTVANQVSCSFAYEYESPYTLFYKMAVSGGVTLSTDNPYSIKLSYTGTHTFDCTATYLELCPQSSFTIKRVEAYDLPNAIFDFYLANENSDNTYVATLDGVAQAPMIPMGDGVYRADFDYKFAKMYDGYNCQCYFNVSCEAASEYADISHSFNGVGEGPYDDENTMYNGIGAPEFISNKATSLWVNSNYKYDWTDYVNTDKGTATLYNGNTGAVVASCSLSYAIDENASEEDEEIGYLIGEMALNGNLDINTKYILSVYDGYDVRLRTVKVTDKPVCEEVAVTHDGNNEIYRQQMPTGETATAEIYGLANADNLSLVDVKIYEYNTENIVYEKTGNVTTSDGYLYKLTLARKAEVNTEAMYELIAYYDDIELCRVGLYPQGGGSSGGGDMWANERIFTDNASYMIVQNSKDMFDPTRVDFTFETADGTTIKEVIYHRALTPSSLYYHYVLKINDNLSSYGNEWVLKASYNGEVIAENPVYGARYKTEPFVYEQHTNIDGYLHIYGEGFEDNADYAMYLWDDNTQQEIKLNVEKTGGVGTFKIPTNATEAYATDYRLFFTMNGEPVSLVDTWYFITGSPRPVASFYSLYSTQNHRIAAIKLNSRDYAYYRIAESEEDLAAASYKPAVGGITYILPEAESVVTLYGQLKTASGDESPILTTDIALDTKAPELISLTNVAESYTAKENSWGELTVDIKFTVNVGDEGTLEYYLADEKGERVTNVYLFNTVVGENNINRYGVYVDDYMMKAAQLVVYMVDDAGNKSKELSAPTSIVEKYTKYTVGKTIYYIDNETGSLDRVDSENETVEVPSSLGGKPVTVINSNAFSQEYTIKKIVLPETITTIAYGAFSNMALKEINIPSKVTILSNDLFSNTSSLRIIHLPAGLKKVENGAFDSVPSGNLDVYFSGTQQQWNSVTIISGGNSVLNDGNAKIHFADGIAKVEKVYDEGYDMEGMLVTELTLIGEGNGTKKVVINGNELYYSIQNGRYVGVLSDGKTSGETLEEGIFVLDEAPTELVYGNIDGDYSYDDIEEAVDTIDLQVLKQYAKGLTTLPMLQLISADLDGDGLADVSDLQVLKMYLKSGGTLVFGVLQ